MENFVLVRLRFNLNLKIDRIEYNLSCLCVV